MKGRHISATAEDKPCRSEHTNKALRTKDNPKGLTGSVHATWQDRRKA